MWKSKRHSQRFGWRNFRVLFVTTSLERVDNMIACANEHALTKESPLYLFADKTGLYQSDVLTHNWIDARSASQQLLP